MSRINFQIPVVVLLFICGCVEPFFPSFPQNSASLLVVEGSITDAEGPQTVHLTRSFEISSSEATPVSGAGVAIEEEDGAIASLNETSPGIYSTTDIQGKVGKRYRLSFTLNGDQYVSSWVRIRQSPPMDSVYWRLSQKETSDPEVTNPGIQILVATDGSESDVQYYRWVWDETWEISVNHPTFWTYVGKFEVERRDDMRNLCWSEFSPRTINVLTTKDLGRNVISGHPLLFVTNAQERLTRRYSLVVKQYALEEEEYTFWKNLEESNERSADLFDKQPARVIGNIQNTGNPEEVVLGYFWASGVSEKRIFIKNSEVTPELRRRPKCNLDTVRRSFRHDFRLFQRLRAGQIFYDFWRDSLTGQILGSLVTTPRCSDCVFKGGKIEKPEFWDD